MEEFIPSVWGQLPLHGEEVLTRQQRDRRTREEANIRRQRLDTYTGVLQEHHEATQDLEKPQRGVEKLGEDTTPKP
jgi:hypothetical protein